MKKLFNISVLIILQIIFVGCLKVSDDSSSQQSSKTTEKDLVADNLPLSILMR